MAPLNGFHLPLFDIQIQRNYCSIFMFFKDFWFIVRCTCSSSDARPTEKCVPNQMHIFYSTKCSINHCWLLVNPFIQPFNSSSTHHKSSHYDNLNPRNFLTELTWSQTNFRFLYAPPQTGPFIFARRHDEYNRARCVRRWCRDERVGEDPNETTLGLWKLKHFGVWVPWLGFY